MMDVTMLNFKTRSIFIFGVSVLLQCTGCASTIGTIVFIYDKQDTTAYDIEWLSGNIKEVAKILYSYDGRFDYNFKIVFPYQSYIEEISKNSTTTTSKTDSNIKAQTTLESLHEQLQQSPSYSSIFVITNVTESSKDILLRYNVLEQMQIKRTQVNFILGTTELCSTTFSIIEYRLITSISSNGFVMSPDVITCGFVAGIHNRITQFPQTLVLLSFIDEKTGTSVEPEDSFINFCKNNLIQTSANPYEYELYREKPYRSTVTNAIQRDGGGYSVHIEIETTEGEVPFQCPLCDGKQKKISVKGGYARGFHGDFYNFEYGFSTANVRSLNETFRRPIKGSNYIYVSTNDEIWEHAFHHFKILFINGSYYGERIPLHWIEDTDLFQGSFEAPNREYFFIEVTTFINGSATVSRLTNTAMNTVDEFGDDKNPAFEYNPAYKNNHKPVSLKSATYKSHGIKYSEEEDNTSNTGYSINFYNIMGWIFCSALMGLAIPCVPYYFYKIYDFFVRKFSTCCKRRRKQIPKRLESKKADNQAVPKVDTTVADRKASK